MRKLAKLLLVIAFIACPVIQTAAEINPEDILGIWTFDEGDEEGARDLSGNDHDGEIVGNVELVDGKFGKAIEFAGGHIVVEHADDMSLETFSLTAWVNVPKIVDPYQFIVGREAWPDRNYSMWIRPGTVVVGFTNGGDKQVAGASVVGGEWHHVAGTYDGNTLMIYADGIRGGQVSPASTPKTCICPLMIGAQPPGASAGLIQGIIDDVAVFKVALEEDDIKRVMEDGLRTLALAVEAKGKLFATWAALKSIY